MYISYTYTFSSVSDLYSCANPPENLEKIMFIGVQVFNDQRLLHITMWCSYLPIAVFDVLTISNVLRYVCRVDHKRYLYNLSLIQSLYRRYTE